MKRKNAMKLGLTAGILGMSLFLAGCNSNQAEESETQDVQNTKEVQNLKELVQDYSAREIEAESVSITSHELLVTNNDGSKDTYDLSEEDFFVSIAPYENQTHPCANHSLSGCQAELVDKEFDVYIEDEEGNVVADEVMKTQSNGFFDLWLPRDKTYQIMITYDGKTSEAELSTSKGDNTCITTMQLT